MPIGRGVDKKPVVHSLGEMLLGHIKEKLLPFATAWMDLENIMLCEISQSEKDKYHMVSLMWNLMNKLN